MLSSYTLPLPSISSTSSSSSSSAAPSSSSASSSAFSAAPPHESEGGETTEDSSYQSSATRPFGTSLMSVTYGGPSSQKDFFVLYIGKSILSSV